MRSERSRPVVRDAFMEAVDDHWAENNMPKKTLQQTHIAVTKQTGEFLHKLHKH